MSVVYLSIATTVYQVPYANRFVVCATYQVLSVWMEHQVSDPVVMATQGHHTNARLYFKDANALVSRTSGNEVLQLFLAQLYIGFLFACVDFNVTVIGVFREDITFDLSSKHGFALFKIILELGYFFTDSHPVCVVGLGFIQAFAFL